MFWIKHRRLILWILYALFFLHAYIWYAMGYQRIGQFGFGEIFLTLETGMVTAGTIFVLAVFIHALFFGGLFCGWFCHWGVSQDVLAWIMEKCGIKPVMRHLDSKYVQWTWFIILIAQVIFHWYFNGFPQKLEFNPSFTEVWAGNPKSILMICMTCIISGFLLIFLFGERAFCRSICTFRLWFSWFDKFAPYRIRRTKECSACSNECTNSCFMDVNVAKEIKINGVINNTACVKCFKCMGACPHGVLNTSFKKGENEKNEPIENPTSQFDTSISIAQVLLCIILLHLVGYSIGGNMTLSSAFILGFVLTNIWHSKTISPFYLVLIPLCGVGLYYGNDMNPVSSLIKGLIAIAIFIIIAKSIGFEKGFKFLDDMPGKIKAPVPLIILLLIPAIYFGTTEAIASYYLNMAATAGKNKDWKTYADLYEKWGEYHNNKYNLYYDLGTIELNNLDRYDESLNSFEKSLDLSYREDLAIDIADTYLNYNLPLHAKKLLNHVIANGHDSETIRSKLAETEQALEAKAAAVLGH